jgi:hypothetical protein
MRLMLNYASKNLRIEGVFLARPTQGSFWRALFAVLYSVSQKGRLRSLFRQVGRLCSECFRNLGFLAHVFIPLSQKSQALRILHT